jgi:hypothetical protein
MRVKVMTAAYRGGKLADHASARTVGAAWAGPIDGGHHVRDRIAGCHGPPAVTGGQPRSLGWLRTAE